MDDQRRRHAAIWAAIERVAERQGLSTSGLARRAGMDPTAFNRSKRVKDGEPRWPSTETIASVIAVAGISWIEFGRIVDEG